SKECLCSGFREIVTPGWGGYVGCAPEREPEFKLTSGKDFTVQAIRANDHDEFVIYSAFRGSRFDEMGLTMGFTVEAVDGVVMRNLDDVNRVFEALPKR